MKKQYTTVVAVFFLAVIICFISCGRNDREGSGITIYEIQDEAGLDSVKSVLAASPDDIGANLSILSYYTLSGRLGEALDISFGLSDMALADGDSLSYHISRTYTALAYTMMNKIDSIAPYINSVEYISDHDTSTVFSILANNTAAIYSMKEGLYFSKAMKFLKRGLKVAENNNDHFNQAAILCNMAAIYLIRKDTSGMYYARAAYRQARLSGAQYIVVGSALSLSEMLLLKGDSKQAEAYADTALLFVGHSSDMSQLSYIYTIRAEARFKGGDAPGAESDFGQASLFLEMAAPDVKAKYLLEYGRFLCEMGKDRIAKEVLTELLEDPACRNELLQDTYLLLSEVSYRMGRPEEALRYYKLFHESSDKLSMRQRELDFNTLLRNYEQAEFAREIAAREIMLERSNRTATYVITILAIVCITIFNVLLVYRKKNQMYRNLVSQHQQYINKKKQICEDVMLQNSGESDRDSELFNRIETLMSESQAYCQKDISLEKIAEAISSNRAYVSKVINKYSGQPFYSYINAKRMERAISILSDPDDDTPLKLLSDSLGYKSLSTFYRAFQKETGCPPSRYREEVRRIKSETSSSCV